ncbi:hypothetical protein BH20ACT2_BH20ACT2_05820 [soil metagenome]
MVFQVGHTSEFQPALLERARSLLEAVFEGEFFDEDWEHSLGGVHVVARRAHAVELPRSVPISPPFLDSR